MRKFLVVLVVFCVVLCVSCKMDIPTLTPTPTPTPPLIRIPSWVNTPADIDAWCKTSGADYVSDEQNSGYKHYVFSPAEMLMTEIPDTITKKGTIRKHTWIGDCDDWAVFTAWVMSEIGLKAHYVEIYTTGSGHAISYGIDKDGKCHVFDLWYYRGNGYKDIYDYVKRNYPEWRLTKDVPIMDFLEILFARGHVKYLPTEEDTRPDRKSAGRYCTITGACE